MKLQSLQIEIEPSYSDNAGQYKGKIKFENQKGSVAIQLTSRLCDRLLEVVAEELIYTARKVATELTANCIDSVKQLENKL